MSTGRKMIFILLLLLPFAANAQWELMESKVSAGMSSLVFLEDGIHGWAAGTSSAGPITMRFIFRTTDSGETWSQFSCPFYARDMAFVSPDSGWGVGDSGKIYQTLDGGESWTQQASGTTRQLNSVIFINNLEGWACGGWESGPYLVLHTDNGGETWEDQSFGSGYSCTGLSFSDSQNGWIGGYDSSGYAQIHVTDDGGETWTRQTLPSEVLDSGIESIDFVNENIGWAATSSISIAGCILHTTDGGDSWSIQYITNHHYHGIDAKDENNVVVVGVAIMSPSTEKVYVTSDGGENWTVNTPPIWNYTEGPVYVGEDIWIASNGTSILKSSDYGASWEWSERAPYWRTMSWANSTTARVGSGTSAGTDSYGIISTDSGESWAHEESAPGGTRYSFLDENTGWMLWEGAPGSIWRTTNGGTDWLQSTFGVSAWIGSISFTSPDSGWACGSSGTVRVTTDGGATWTPQNINTSNYVADIYFVDSKEGWAVGGYGGGNAFIRHTSDGGLSWEVQTPPVSNHLQHIFFLDNMNGWIGGLGGVVHRTNNGGTTWQQVDGIPYTPKSILMVTPDFGWITGGRDHDEGGQGYIYFTEDGGDNWTLEWTSPWPKQWIVDLALQDENTIWGVGYHGTILKREFVLGIDEETLNYTTNIVTVSPNPFRESTSVTVELESPGFTELTVFDLSGRMVETITREQLEAGQHSFELNAENLVPGVYLIKLQSDNTSKSTRCVLIP